MYNVLADKFSEGFPNVQCDYMYMLELVYYLVTGTLYVTLFYCFYLIQYKETPVWVAALNGHVGALDVLIRAKADVNAFNLVSLIFIFYMK